MATIWPACTRKLTSVQDLPSVPIVVGEGHVAELDRAARAAGRARAPGRSRTSVCVSSISKIRWRRGDGLLQVRVDAAQLLGRAVHEEHRRDERGELAGREAAGGDLVAAIPERARNANAAQELHERRQRRERARHLHVRAVNAVGGCREPRDLVRFGPERLDDPVTAERLGRDVRDPLQLLLAAPRRPPHALPEAHERDRR